MKPGVFITVDVECSMGGAWGDDRLRPVPPSRAIMGEYGGRRFGLPLIVEMLEANGLKATFFVEPFAEEQGYPGQMDPICHFLLEHGQDVQLHVHPNHKHYGLYRQGKPYPFTDQITDLDPVEQRSLLEEGMDRLAKWTGRKPVAFRAGNMGASEDTLRQLADVGIRIDSSYTFPFAGRQCRFSPTDPFNGSRWYGEVLEVALSGFSQPRFPGLHPSKVLDVVAISFEECRDVIRRICDTGTEAVLILHSFSLFKVRNVQYNGGRLDRIVASRLRRLCHWLGDNSDAYHVRTFGDLDRAVKEGTYEARTEPPPRMGGGRALVRKIVQAYNRLYWI